MNAKIEKDDELSWAPAWQIAELVQSRQISPVEVIDRTLTKIEALNPTLKAFVHIDADHARAAAKAAEAAVLSGNPLGPLHGVPMAVKSHLDVAGWPRPIRPIGIGGTARHDEICVERLRRAGAIIVGLNSMPTFTLEGAPEFDKLSRNPWDLSRIAGASSSGAGASVAAGMIPAAIGTDGGGSTRLPSAFCGLVGMHPTERSVPKRVDPEHFELHIGWTAGPITRDSRDAATILSVIAGPDGRDPLGPGVPLDSPLDGLDRGVSDMRFAWTDDLRTAVQN
ncbi:amidase [Sphingobium sp. CFD-2]|uniref:amidase family protein n=1 Tax=Sphingobium sp. CFD-2 TaxID=2878542 RepID=UPI00214C90A1|nr:amidase [Sphingobium sp. CFD-2]